MPAFAGLTPPGPSSPIRRMRQGEDERKTGRKGAVKWVLSYLRPHRRIFIPSVVALFLTAALSLAFPFFLKDLIGDPADALRSGIDPAVAKSRADQKILWLLGALALQAFISYWRVRGFIRAGEAALNDLRKDLFRHLLK